VLSCTIVMVIIMVFRIPGAALGAYYPLLLSRDNPRSTRRAAVRTGFVCVLGTAEIVLGAMFFVGSPFVHLLWVAGSLFIVFYLISSMALYDAALALGLTVATGITTWDLPIAPEKRLTLTLYTMLSILIGCAVSVVIEYVLAHTHPPDAVLEGIRERLALVGKLLQGHAAGRTDLDRLRTQLTGLATRGTGRLRDQLARSNYAPRYKERLAAAVSLSGRIVDLASDVKQLDPRSVEEDRARCATLSASIDAIDVHLSREQSPGFIPLPEPAQSYTPLLIEIERNVDLLSQSLTEEDHPAHYHLPEPGQDRGLPIFHADAFTSRRHVRFALRGMFSALACYLLYMSVGWTGLGASTATCVLTALSNTGASRHKQLMRFAGMIFGACVIGFATQAIILPQIDSLFAFIILFACVIAVGAWVGTSGPRVAYAGAQIVLAYDLVNLNRFTITTSLVPARDTVLGIMLGIFAMWLIFDHLWADAATAHMRKIFLSTLQDIAQLDVSPEPLPAAGQSRRLLAESEHLNARLDSSHNLADLAVFEPHPKEEEETYLVDCVKTLQPQLRCFLLLKTGLLQHQLIADSCKSNSLASTVQKYAASLLTDTAQAIVAEQPTQAIESENVAGLAASVAATLAQARSEGNSSAVTQMLLSSSLLDVAQHLRSDSLLLNISRKGPPGPSAGFQVRPVEDAP
jgi:multidrug resistance protein MdtO